MTVFVFGNPDLPEDSLPLRLLPELRKLRPDMAFEVKDPNEEWGDVEDITIIDTVVGIKDIKIFNNLNDFVRTPRVSLHDFDAYTNLLFLEKLGKLKKIKIIGVPPEIDEGDALDKISGIINKL